MGVFICSIAIVLVIWAICSLAETAIYAVRMPYVRQLEQAGTEAGQILTGFKAKMEQPIAAILIVNTIAAAAGASLVGAQASAIFGDAKLWLFSACFTVAALLVSEIIPKIVGVAYNRKLAPLLAKPLSLTVFALYPLIWLIERAAIFIKPQVAAATAPEKEVQQLAEISAEEGSIMPYEAELVRNVLDLDKVTAEEIMTPLSVVTALAENLTLGELAKQPIEWNFSRIPLHKSVDSKSMTGFVLSRDVLVAIAQDRFEQPLRSLAKPLRLVPGTAPGHLLLSAFLKFRTHMFAVTGVGGDVVGIITLEDVLESLIGVEIVDELDTVIDMQALGRKKK